MRDIYEKIITDAVAEEIMDSLPIVSFKEEMKKDTHCREKAAGILFILELFKYHI